MSTKAEQLATYEKELNECYGYLSYLEKRLAEIETAIRHKRNRYFDLKGKIAILKEDVKTNKGV